MDDDAEADGKVMSSLAYESNVRERAGDTFGSIG